MVIVNEDMTQEVFAQAKDPLLKDKDQFALDRNRWMVLWLYVCVACERIVDGEKVAEGFYGFENEYTEEMAIKLANCLKENLENGDFADWISHWNSTYKERYTCDENDLKAFIDFCGFSGGFTV
jgi:hypothetical protein